MQGWVHVVSPQDRGEVSRLREQLDPGEAEAIIVACELRAGLLLVDEKRGRRIALERALEVTGLLGVLAEAKSLGLISRCQPILDEMVNAAGFWVGEALRFRYLKLLDELD